MKRVVFLDFDGTLSSDEWLRTHRAADALSPAHVLRVDALCREMGAAVVIVSSWRYFTPCFELAAKLSAAGLTVPVLGAVDELPPGELGRADDGRADGAARWLELWPTVRSWVVLDDDPNAGWERARWKDCWVHVDWMHGVQPADIARAREILGRDAR